MSEPMLNRTNTVCFVRCLPCRCLCLAVAVGRDAIKGGTALMEAATSGSQEVVDLLLAAGADPMIRDKDGVSPLMSAAAQVSAVEFVWPCVLYCVVFCGCCCCLPLVCTRRLHGWVLLPFLSLVSYQ